MKKTRFLLCTSLCSSALIVLFCSFVLGQAPIVTAIAVFVFALCIGAMWQEILPALIGTNPRGMVNRLLSWLGVFFLVGLCGSVAITWYRWNSVVVFGCFVATFVLTFFYAWYVKKQGYIGMWKGIVVQQESVTRRLWHVPKWLFMVYLCLIAIGFWLMSASTSTSILQTPWQAISEFYPFCFFAITLLLGVFLFSKYKSGLLLLCIVLYSLLIHAAVPLSHSLPWGGDVWRMIGIEGRLQTEEVVFPVLFGEGVTTVPVLGVTIPEILTAPHKYVYGHLWASTLLIADTLRVSLLSLNMWLVPVLWGVFFPLLSFRIALLFFRSERYAVWITALLQMPFILQAHGSLTLASSLGFLFFLFWLLLWCSFLEGRRRYQWVLALFFAVLSLFGYSLYAILIWAIMVVSLIFLFAKNISKTALRQGVYWMVGLFGAILLPAIELLLHTSRFSFVTPFFANIKTALAQFSGWAYTTTIATGDILSGNIVFNHTPQYAFIENIFTLWRGHSIVLMALIAAGLCLYMVSLFVKPKKTYWYVLFWVFITVFFGYVVGWFILEGDRSLIRRLDPLLAYCFVFFSFAGWRVFFSTMRFSFSGLHVSLIAAASILFLSVTTTTIALSGPDMRSMAESEYAAAAFVSEHLLFDGSPHCVIADTWLLLALEAKTKSHSIGGGFPIDYQFGQKERVALVQELEENPSLAILQKAHDITQSPVCWIAMPFMLEKQEKIAELREITGEEGVVFDDIFVVKHTLK